MKRQKSENNRDNTERENIIIRAKNKNDQRYIEREKKGKKGGKKPKKIYREAKRQK